MTCLVCGKNGAIVDATFGVLPCFQCQKRQSTLDKPLKQSEFISQELKDQRKAYSDDFHPAHRKGVPSKEFRDRWGAKAMKRQGFTDKEIKNAKDVWNDDRYYKK